jgi:hypothetical protein
MKGIDGRGRIPGFIFIAVVGYCGVSTSCGSVDADGLVYKVVAVGEEGQGRRREEINKRRKTCRCHSQQSVQGM